MRIVWSRDAQDDVFDILSFYDRVDPELADEMVLRIERSPLPLIEFPALGPAVSGSDFRKWMVPGTPFILLYAIAETRIDIRRVRHVASNWTG